MRMTHREAGERSDAGMRNTIGILALRAPFSYVTWISAAVFGYVYSWIDQIFVTLNGAMPAGTGLPLMVKVFGPQPTLGPPQIAYYLAVFGNFGGLQINLSALPIVILLSFFFGLNLSLALLLRRSTGGARSFTPLVSTLPSLVNTAGCCSATPFFLLLAGGTAYSWIGFVLRPYFSAFVLSSFALSIFSIYLSGRRLNIEKVRCRVISVDKYDACLRLFELHARYDISPVAVNRRGDSRVQ